MVVFRGDAPLRVSSLFFEGNDLCQRFDLLPLGLVTLLSIIFRRHLSAPWQIRNARPHRDKKSN